MILQMIKLSQIANTLLQQPMMQSPQTSQILNITSSSLVAVFLTILVILYFTKWRHDSVLILQVLSMLLINQIFYAIAQIIGYIDQQDDVLCTISIIGRMAFGVAANFWIVFITRLVYREALAPGKFYDLLNFVLKNMLFTYIPSLVLSIFLLIIILVNQSESENQCWQIITNTELLDYIIYGLTFILPNLLTSIILIIYMYKLYKLVHTKCTFFLLFSLTSLLFSVYFICIKIYQFLYQNEEMGYLNVIMLIQPIIYGAYFIIIYIRQKNKSMISSTEYTIRGSEGEVSFIEDL